MHMVGLGAGSPRYVNFDSILFSLCNYWAAFYFLSKSLKRGKV